MGDSYNEVSDLKTYMNETPDDTWVYGAFDGTTLVGYRTMSVLMSDYIDELQGHINRNEHTFNLRFFNKVGMLETSCVLPEYRRHGLGSTFTRIGINKLVEAGCDLIVSTSWVSHSKDTSRNILMRHGFTVECELKDFWYEDTLESKTKCSTCGYPCRCSSILMVYTGI
jgi:ribosomal protein S18 acetylase RimI-like enzyme